MTNTPAREEIAVLERCALNAWPALASRECMGWVLRSANGYTKRANSANALAPVGDFDTLRRAAEAHYAALGRPTIFRLSPLAPPDADALLDAAGYGLVDPSLVMSGPMGSTAADPAVTISDRPDERWFHAFAALTGEASPTIAQHRAIVGAIAPSHAVATIARGTVPVAIGLAAVEAGRVGLFDIAVAPEARGNRLAARISGALLAWGRGHGAESAYLQVTEANRPALRAYESLGFTPAYRYHYRVHPLDRSLLDDSSRRS